MSFPKSGFQVLKPDSRGARAQISSSRTPSIFGGTSAHAGRSGLRAAGAFAGAGVARIANAVRLATTTDTDFRAMSSS